MGLQLKKHRQESIFTFEYAYEAPASARHTNLKCLDNKCYNRILKKIEYYLAYVSLLDPELEKYILLKDIPLLNNLVNVTRRSNIPWEFRSANTKESVLNSNFLSNSSNHILLSSEEAKAVVDLPDDLFDSGSGNITIFAVNKGRVDLLHYLLSSLSPISIKDFLTEGEVFLNLDLGNQYGFFESITIKTKSQLQNKITEYNKLITKRGFHLLEEQVENWTSPF